MNYMKLVTNVLSAIFGIVAAFLWLKASLVKAPSTNKPDETGWIPAQIVADGSDFVATAIRQSFWNKWAAGAASVAATFQAIGVTLPE